ncbi:MAG: hypothetical protein GSR78_04150 [Desulfurococcales archaeon]|nr:hypothetical protein [Desulfurococcales archaeon]
MPKTLRLESAASLSIAVLLIIGSLYFLSNSVQLIQLEEPRVAASLLSAVIGLSLLSAGVTLLRTWVVARVYEEARKEADAGEARGQG